MSRRGAGRRRVSGARIRAPNSELRAPTAPPAPGLRLSGFGRLPGGGRLPGFGGCRATVGVGRRRVSGARIRTPSSELRPPRQPPAAGCRASAGCRGSVGCRAVAGVGRSNSNSELRAPNFDRPASPRPLVAGLRWAAGRRLVSGARLELRRPRQLRPPLRSGSARGTRTGERQGCAEEGLGRAGERRRRGAGRSELGVRSSGGCPTNCGASIFVPPATSPAAQGRTGPLHDHSSCSGGGRNLPTALTPGARRGRRQRVGCPTRRIRAGRGRW